MSEDGKRNTFPAEMLLEFMELHGTGKRRKFLNVSLSFKKLEERERKMSHNTTFARRAFEFYRTLTIPAKLPAGIIAMNPYQNLQTREYSRLFLQKYFNDSRKRIFVFGINPGRFGAGLTGVTFTDPVALREFCGIPNGLGNKRELSSEFIYKFIARWGGVEKFYKNFFLTAVSPLGFLKDGKNYNFYDHKELLRVLRPFLLQTISAQLGFGANREVAIVLGSGKNAEIFRELNKEGRFFKRVYALEHPRFIMQYRRKRVEEYLKKYEKTFREAQKYGK